MTYQETLADTKARMDKAIAHTQDLLRGIRTSRASAALVENVRVDYYGSPTPLNQLASISVPAARQLVIKPFDAQALEAIGKAIMKSDLGISPENDGKVIRLNMPPLSGEQRQKYAVKAREICEEGRVAMRNVRRDVNKHADALKKSGDITEDDNRQLHDEIQELLKGYEEKLSGVQDKKTTEIMEV